MALNLARIIGTITGKLAFERTDANFMLVQTDVNKSTIDIGDKATLATDVKTNLVVAVNEHETQINTLDANKANKAQEAWITPTLLNGWVQVPGKLPVGYMKDEFGFVHLRGQVKGASSGVIFILPLGYGTAGQADFVTIADGTIAQLGIADGNLYPNRLANSYYSLENIVFKTY